MIFLLLLVSLLLLASLVMLAFQIEFLFLLLLVFLLLLASLLFLVSLMFLTFLLILASLFYSIWSFHTALYRTVLSCKIRHSRLSDSPTAAVELLLFFSAIGLSENRMSDWKILETIRLSDQGIDLSDIGLTKKYLLPSSE
jgi:hypothetical protein